MPCCIYVCASTLQALEPVSPSRSLHAERSTLLKVMVNATHSLSGNIWWYVATKVVRRKVAVNVFDVYNFEESCEFYPWEKNLPMFRHRYTENTVRSV